MAEFLDWFDAHVGMSPVWLCPLRLREPQGPGSATAWPLYPLEPGQTYVNIGFWGMVDRAPGSRDGDVNRAIEQTVRDCAGHKSLYSDAYYDRATFERLYAGEHLRRVKARYDPGQRLSDLYDKTVLRA